MQLMILAALAISIPPVQSQQPNLQPSLASVPGLTALVFGSGNSIWFAASSDNGHHFSQPSEVGRVPKLPLGRHRGPRVVISAKSIVVSAIYDEPADTATSAPGLPGTRDLPVKGDLVAWRSQDGGRSWSKPLVINDASGSAREGLHAMAAGEHGEMAAVWLDLRAKGTRIYGSYSTDAGASWSRNVLVYESPEGTVCQCCDPSLAWSGNNQFEVMFRNALAGSRDLYLMRWTLGAALPNASKVGKDTWKLEACPMDGGGVVSRAGLTVTAWRRDKTVYLDKPGQPETAIGNGKDVAVALARQGPYVVWSGSSGIELYQPDRTTARTLSPQGGFPVLAALPDRGVLAAWQVDGKIELQLVDEN